MPTPSPRTPVRCARGTYANLLASLADLKEGELVYAQDQEVLYIKEAGVLVPVTVVGAIDELNDLIDVILTSPSAGKILKYNGTHWVDDQISYADITGTPPTTESINDLTDVVITSPSAGKVLRHNGTAWVDAQLSYSDLSNTPTLITGINDLTDVDTATTPPTNGQVLSWNGTNWVPVNPAGAVTSVNTQTGAVSIGIQDLDDFSLTYPPPANPYYEWNVGEASSSLSCPDAGKFSTTTARIGAFDKNNSSRLLFLQTAPLYWSVNGGQTWQLMTWTSTSVSSVCSSNSQVIYNGVTNSWVGQAQTNSRLLLANSNLGPVLPATLSNGDYLRYDGSYFRPKKLATVAESGSYTDLANKPNLSTVATSGSYNDLSNKPTIPSSIDDLSDVLTKVPVYLWNVAVPSFASVDANGEYYASTLYFTTSLRLFGTDANGLSAASSLAGKPSGTIIWWKSDTVTTWQQTSLTGAVATIAGGAYEIYLSAGTLNYNTQLYFAFINPALEAVTGSYLRYNGTNFVPSSLATVATSGSYNDLSNRPTFATVATSGSYNDLTNRPSFATVATSGSYNDLSNKPYIPLTLDDLTDVKTAALTFYWATKVAALGDVNSAGKFTYSFSFGTAYIIVFNTDTNGKSAASTLAGKTNGTAIWWRSDVVTTWQQTNINNNVSTSNGTYTVSLPSSSNFGSNTHNQIYLSFENPASYSPTNKGIIYNGTEWGLGTFVQSNTTLGGANTTAIANMVRISQADYDSLATKDSNTLYVII